MTSHETQREAKVLLDSIQEMYGCDYFDPTEDIIKLIISALAATAERARREALEEAASKFDSDQLAGQTIARVRSNGHIHASCSTEKCVRWME